MYIIHVSRFPDRDGLGAELCQHLGSDGHLDHHLRWYQLRGGCAMWIHPPGRHCCAMFDAGSASMPADVYFGNGALDGNGSPGVECVTNSSGTNTYTNAGVTS